MPNEAWAGALVTEIDVVLGMAQLIELAGAIAIAWHVALACVAALRPNGYVRARMVVADGVLTALSFMVAGTLLKTMALRSWHQIGMFAFVLAFRTLLKQVFVWEERAGIGAGERT